jgi:hypothetical protein
MSETKSKNQDSKRFSLSDLYAAHLLGEVPSVFLEKLWRLLKTDALQLKQEEEKYLKKKKECNFKLDCLSLSSSFDSSSFDSSSVVTSFVTSSLSCDMISRLPLNTLGVQVASWNVNHGEKKMTLESVKSDFKTHDVEFTEKDQKWLKEWNLFTQKEIESSKIEIIDHLAIQCNVLCLQEVTRPLFDAIVKSVKNFQYVSSWPPFVDEKNKKKANNASPVMANIILSKIPFRASGWFYKHGCKKHVVQGNFGNNTTVIVNVHLPTEENLSKSFTANLFSAMGEISSPSIIIGDFNKREPLLQSKYMVPTFDVQTLHIWNQTPLNKPSYCLETNNLCRVMNPRSSIKGSGNHDGVVSTKHFKKWKLSTIQFFSPVFPSDHYPILFHSK